MPRHRSKSQKTQIVKNARTKIAPHAAKVGRELVSMTSLQGLIACSLGQSPFRSDWIGTGSYFFDAFFSREPVPTSLENALAAAPGLLPHLVWPNAFASEIGGDQIVGAPASANIDPGSSGTDHITIGIEGAQETRFIGTGIRLNSSQRTFVDKERCLDRAVVPPKSHGVASLVI